MNKEILEHLMEYLQQKIDSGEHKIFYNDLMYDEKIIDCINAVNDSLKEIERLNNIIKEVREELIDLFGTDDKEINNILEILDKGE